MGTIKAGVLSYGRSGRGIHCRSMKQLPGKYEIVAVCEQDDSRRETALNELGCRVYGDLESFLGDGEIELVSIATPSHMHVEHAMAALNAGKNIVCDKPIAGRVADVDRLIESARRSGKIFAPFHNYRHHPVFSKVKEIADSGIIGNIVEVKITEHFFMRRWDWQTMRKFNGGSLNNRCTHLVDYGMQFLPEEDEYRVFCHMDKILTSGDAEDHVKIIIKGEKSPLLDIEATYAAAYAQNEAFLLVGTRGGVKGVFENNDSASGRGEVWWKYFNPDTLAPKRRPDKAVSDSLNYELETVECEEQHWQVPSDAMYFSDSFYESLYGSLKNGAPLSVTPESARKVVWVIERCHEMTGL